MQDGNQSGKRSLFGKSLAWFGGTTLLAAVAPFLLDGAARTGVVAGVVTGAFASLCALGLLSLAFDRGMKMVLGALAVGFLLRMLLVAAGLLSSMALGGESLAFVAAFFGLYLAHQIIEFTVVVKRSRSVPAEGQA